MAEKSVWGQIIECGQEVLRDVLEPDPDVRAERLRAYYKRGTEDLKSYPYKEGEGTVLGPETILHKDKKVICYQGQNYYKSDRITEVARQQRLGQIIQDLQEFQLQVDALGAANVILQKWCLSRSGALGEIISRLQTLP